MKLPEDWKVRVFIILIGLALCVGSIWLQSKSQGLGN